jgi:Cu/Ag efflux pump CusA
MTMRAFTGTIVKFRFLLLLLAAAVPIVGISQLRRMPADVWPEFSPPYVEIQTEALGLSAEEVEQLITVPLEHNLINGVAWLDKVRSQSVPGLSSVVLRFEPGTDLYRARQMVAERLSQAAVVLPRVSTGPVMLQPKSGTSRVLVVRLSSKALSAIQMSVLARWTITPRLMGVPGVANVATWGMRDRQLQVHVDPERLSAYRVPLRQVIESVGNALWVSSLSYVEAATPGNAGFIDTPQQRLGIQHISPILSPEQLAQVSVQHAGTPLMNEVDPDDIPKDAGAVRLSDVADVVEDHQPLIGDALAGDGANLLLVIEKFPGSDTVAVTRGVEDAFAALRPGLSDMAVDSSVFRPATFIERAREHLTRTGGLAAAASLLVIALLFRTWRATVISLVTIPLTLFAAVLVLYLRGATLNAMTVLGLVLASGVVVDETVVLVENVLRRLRSRPGHAGPQSPATVVVEAVRQLSGGLLSATLICLLPVVPVFSLPGGAGSFFQPLAVSYALAVAASTCVALVFTPALCATLLSNASKRPRTYPASPAIRALESGYLGLLRRLLARPHSAYVTMAVVAAAGVAAMPLVRPALLPTFKERDLLIHLEATPGTSRPAMTRLVDLVTHELREIPGVSNATALVGRAVFGDRIVGINAAEVVVNLAPTADYGASVAAVQTAVAGYPWLKIEVQTYLRQVSSPVIAAASAPLVVRIYGQDWSVLRRQAEDLRPGLSGIAGVGDLHVSPPVEEPTLEVEVDPVAAQRHGINPGTVRRAASTLVNGLQVGSLFQEQKMFDVVVWSAPKTRSSLADIGALPIDTPFLVPVRLEDVATLRLASRPSVITREDVSRYLDIAVTVHGRNVAAVMDDIRAHVRQVRFPLEYHAQVVGAYEEQQAARHRLLAFAAVAVMGIVLLLQAAFDDWRLAFLSCFTLPLALAGGVLGLAMAGVHNTSLCVVFGLLTVFGIAVRHQVVFIRRLRQLQRDRAGISARRRLVHAARECFPSMTMTGLTIAAGLVPVLLMGDGDGLAVVWSTALVVLMGMLTCTLVNLFVVPTLYLRIAERPVPGEPL